MQRFRASAFYTIVHWHKSGEVDDECTSHNSIVLAICEPKIIKFGRDLLKFWQKQVGTFLDHPVLPKNGQKYQQQHTIEYQVSLFQSQVYIYNIIHGQ